MNNKTEAQTDIFSIKQQLKQLETRMMRPGMPLKRLKGKKKDEIAFAISLKSKTVSRNWNKVQANLSKTLRSILQNTDPNFIIIIAGHEKPVIAELQDKRVKWLRVKFSPPKGPGGFSGDKLRKRKVIGAYLRRKGFSGYFMPLDADDWIHYRFVEYIRSRPRTDAFILKKGFMVNLVTKESWLRQDRFYIGCGSSAVFYFSKKDFPHPSQMKNVKKTPFGMVLKAHPKVARHLEEQHKKYTMVDLPFVTWVLGHGDNNSMIKGKKDNSVSAKNYGSKGEKLQGWMFDYFKTENRSP